MANELMCKRRDKDVGGLVCGHPLPCPYHTVVIDTEALPVPTVTIPATASKDIDAAMLKKLKKIARIMSE